MVWDRAYPDDRTKDRPVTFAMVLTICLNKIRLKYLIPSIILAVFLIDLSGLLLHWYEKDYETQFNYPLKGDIRKYMEQLRMGRELEQVPINEHNYIIRTWSKSKCAEKSGEFQKNIRLVYIVKSAIEHFNRRQVIRKTWGFERRFADVNIRTVFLLGTHPQSSDKIGEEDEIQKKINDEYRDFGDIVQGNFIDSYYNNTIKTMMGLRWAAEACPKARFYAFVDDDYYVSTRNMLRFLRNPVNYPTYLEDPVISFDDIPSDTARGPDGRRKLHQVIDFDLPDDAVLYAGFVFHSPPHRHKTSKWYLPLEEYPYHLLPPYVTAGAFVLSNPALKDFYYGSYFVKRFRFDDVFMGLVAKKLEIEPFHCPEFHFYKKPYTPGHAYRYTVASHGFSDPEELDRVWNKQKEFGNA